MDAYSHESFMESEDCCRHPPRRSSARDALRSAAAALLLVLVSVLLTAGISALLCRCCTQEVTPAESHDGVPAKLQSRDEYPRAMLTAPRGNISVGNRLRWEDDMGFAFCHGGFNYSDGYLWVPVDGHYNLMLQITYKYHPDVSCALSNHSLSYKVWVYQREYRMDQLLLSVLDTVSCSTKFWDKSLHVSRFFYLPANSRLKVNSSHTSLIVKKEHSTFFGVELSRR